MKLPLRISRRSFLSQSAAVAAGLGFAGTHNPWALGQTREPLALALTIGLNDVHPAGYPRQRLISLTGPENDARTMQSIAQRSGQFARGQILPLLGPKATIGEVLRHIAWAAAILRPGDLFMVSYSGHGSYVTDEANGDETSTDNQDETWCLFNGHLMDDILYRFWARFAEDVRIVVFSDSCHSGSVTKAIQALEEAKSAGLPVPKSIIRPQETEAKLKSVVEQQMVLDKFKSAGTPGQPKAMKAAEENAMNAVEEIDAVRLIKSLPESVRLGSEAAQAKQISDLRALYPTYGDKAATDPVFAKGLLFGACDDSETAWDGNPNSHFTEKLVGSLQGGAGQSYNDLFANVSARTRPKAKFFPFGQEDTRFYAEPLFRLG